MVLWNITLCIFYIVYVMHRVGRGEKEKKICKKTFSCFLTNTDTKNIQILLNTDLIYNLMKYI